MDVQKFIDILHQSIVDHAASAAEMEDKDGRVADKDVIQYTHQMAVASALQIIGEAVIAASTKKGTMH